MADNPVLKRWEENAKSWTVLVRAGYDVYRDVLNTPAFLTFLPAIVGLKGLDIGCGEAGNTKVLARKGATMFGIDFAPTFIRHAREAEQHTPLDIEFHLADCKELPFAQASFDFAVAFMSLMDVDDLDRALETKLTGCLSPAVFCNFRFCTPVLPPLAARKYVMRTAIRSVAHRENISHPAREKSNLGRSAPPRMISRPGTQSLLSRAFTGQFQVGLAA